MDLWTDLDGAQRVVAEVADFGEENRFRRVIGRRSGQRTQGTCHNVAVRWRIGERLGPTTAKSAGSDRPASEGDRDGDSQVSRSGKPYRNDPMKWEAQIDSVRGRKSNPSRR